VVDGMIDGPSGYVSLSVGGGMDWQSGKAIAGLNDVNRRRR